MPCFVWWASNEYNVLLNLDNRYLFGGENPFIEDIHIQVNIILIFLTVNYEYVMVTINKEFMYILFGKIKNKKKFLLNWYSPEAWKALIRTKYVMYVQII